MASMKGIPLSKVSPAFLYANSTSHTWVFSAFAEIIDNAYDPDVSASELLIDKVDIRGTSCLIFLDNGAGMDADHLLKMLSFGFCEKDIYEKQGSHQPIGHYGNGFKSGSMRIGHDTLVFTRCPKSASIGFLSQTYLKSIQADSVMVPLLEYRLPKLERIKSQESRNNLNAILEYSVFKSEHELKEELKALEGSKTGTKIIIYNLKKLQDGTSELDFASDPTDIRCPEAHEVDATSVYHRPIQQNASEYKRSLREYCSILFLRPRMKITIRGVRVKSKLISKSLSNTEIDMYKPTWLSRPVKIIFGFACDSQRPEDSDYGMMLYHRNRLIKAFEKVGYQKQPNDLGIGVVGVAQVDFLQPIHNKQDFNKDEKFNSVMSAFANKLNDYWNEKKGSSSSEQPVVRRNLPDWSWAQCEHCLKWRRLPDEIDPNSLPEQWFCRMNPDATHNRCDIPEEPEDEDLAVKPTYEKTFKKKQEEKKRLQQIEREKEETWKRRRIMEKEQELQEKEAVLLAIQQVAAIQPLQDNRTVVSLQKALAEARRREEQQKRLILQIQEQKKAMEEQRNSLLQMAETLQASEQMNSEEVFEQMSQFLSNIGPNFATSTQLPLSSKGKIESKTETEESQPLQNGRRKRKVNLQTESEDLISVDEDVEIVAAGPTAKNLAKQPKSSKPNIPAVKTESVKKLAKQQSNSPAIANNSRVPTPKNSRLVSPAAASLEPSTEVEAGTTTASSPAVAKRKRQRKGAVMDVIDLTDEGEFSEVADVKPNLAECGATSDGGGQAGATEVKSETGAPTEVLRNEDVEVIPKEEICETATPNTTSSPSADKPSSANIEAPASDATQGIHFRPSEGCELMGDPESLQDNLEAAIAAIQDRMEKEKCQQENDLTASDNKDDIIKDEIKGESITNNSEVVGRDKEVGSGQIEGGPCFSGSPKLAVVREMYGPQPHTDDCEQDMTREIENIPPILTFNDLLPVEDNDITDHPADDRSDYGNRSLIDDDDDGGESFNSCDAVGGDSVDQDDVESPSYSTTGQEAEGEIIDPVEEPVSESCDRELQEKAESNFSCGFTEAENVTDCSSGTAGSHAGKLNDKHQENLTSSMAVLKCDTLPSNSDGSGENSLNEPKTNSKESHIIESFVAEDFLRAENTLEHASPHSDHSTAVNDDVSFEDLRDESVTDHLHIKNKLLCLEDSDPCSTHILNGSAIGKSVTLEESTRSIDINDDTIINNVSLHEENNTNVENKTNHQKNSTSVENKTILKNSEVNHCTSKSVCDQYIQTDIDMAAVMSAFRHRDSSPLQIFNHKDVQSTKEPANSQYSGKSSQVSDLSTNSEAQTDITLSENSRKDPEILNSLQKDISLKTELIEKTEARLAETYANIHKLLGFIVPSAELGDISNIHQVVKDMVKYSEASPQQPLKGSIDVS